MSKHDDDQRPKGTATKLLADAKQQGARTVGKENEAGCHEGVRKSQR